LNISPKLLELETSNLVGGYVLGMPSRRTNNFPESGRGLGHVTTRIFGSTVGYPSDSLASCSNSFPLAVNIARKFLFVVAKLLGTSCSPISPELCPWTPIWDFRLVQTLQISHPRTRAAANE